MAAPRESNPSRSLFQKLSAGPYSSRTSYYKAVSATKSNELIAFFESTRYRNVYKYSPGDDKWSTLRIMNRRPHTAKMCHDKVNDIIFIGDDDKGSIVSIDLSNGATIMYPSGRREFPHDIYNMVVIGRNLYVFCHFYGRFKTELGLPAVSLQILDTVSQTITKFLPVLIGKCSIQHISYSKSRDSILLLTAGKRSNRQMSKFHLYEYSLSTNQCIHIREWNEEGATLSGTFVRTLNQRYIVRFGGFSSISSADWHDQIDVYDLESATVTKSDIKCPKRCSYEAALLGNNQKNECAVFGFVRGEYKAKNMQNVQDLPVHVIQLISHWYSNEMVHLIADDEEKTHWRIDIDHIITSIST